jgi:hypothetical protein
LTVNVKAMSPVALYRPVWTSAGFAAAGALAKHKAVRLPIAAT